MLASDIVTPIVDIDVGGKPTTPATTKELVSIAEFERVSKIAQTALDAVVQLKNKVQTLEGRILELEKESRESQGNSRKATITRGKRAFSTGMLQEEQRPKRVQKTDTRTRVKIAQPYGKEERDDDALTLAQEPSTSTAIRISKDNFDSLMKTINRLEGDMKDGVPQKRAPDSDDDDADATVVASTGLDNTSTGVILKVLRIYNGPELYDSCETNRYSATATYPTAYVIELDGRLDLGYVCGQLEEFLFEEKQSNHNYVTEKIGEMIQYYPIAGGNVKLLKDLSKMRESKALTREATTIMTVMRCAPFDELIFDTHKIDDDTRKTLGRKTLRAILEKREQTMRFMKDIDVPRCKKIEQFRTDRKVGLHYVIMKNDEGNYYLAD